MPQSPADPRQEEEEKEKEPVKVNRAGSLVKDPGSRNCLLELSAYFYYIKSKPSSFSLENVTGDNSMSALVIISSLINLVVTFLFPGE